MKKKRDNYHGNSHYNSKCSYKSDDVSEKVYHNDLNYILVITLQRERVIYEVFVVKEEKNIIKRKLSYYKTYSSHIIHINKGLIKT